MKVLKIIRKIILAILGLLLVVELFAIPFILIFNHNYPKIIDVKNLFIYDISALFITYIIGLIFYELTHTKKEKNENKSR